MEPVTAVTYYMRHPELNLLVPEERRDRFESVATVDTVEIFRNKRAFPRAFLVGNTEVIEDNDAMFKRMADPEVDPASTALLEKPLSLPIPEGVGSPGEARYLGRPRTDTAVVEVTATRPALLVLADAYYPGWRAYIDSVPADIVPVYTIFRGVRVEPGEHRVEFRYEPASFRVGLLISVVALIAGTLVAIASFFQYFRVSRATR